MLFDNLKIGEIFTCKYDFKKRDICIKIANNKSFNFRTLQIEIFEGNARFFEVETHAFQFTHVY